MAEARKGSRGRKRSRKRPMPPRGTKRSPVQESELGKLLALAAMWVADLIADVRFWHDQAAGSHLHCRASEDQPELLGRAVAEVR